VSPLHQNISASEDTMTKKRNRRENPASVARRMLSKLAPRKSAALEAIADELEQLQFGESEHLTITMDMPHPPRDCNAEEKRSTYGNTSIVHPKCTSKNCTHHGMPVPTLQPTKSVAEISAKIESNKKEQHE
jgi:hypothetical protein